MTPGPDAPTMSPDDAERTLFGDTLTAVESMPLRLTAWCDERSTNLQARAEWMLRLLGQIESGAADHDEEHADPTLRRIEAKLDLTLDLLASVLAASQAPPAAVDLRWSHLGVSYVAPSGRPSGDRAILHLYLRPWLPTPLELPVQWMASRSEAAGERLWLAFQLDQPGVQRALDKLLFRQHRRQIAQTRRDTHG
ncbi:MAG: PilZ domain-containing protein [Lysobacteraceae bacterium]